MPYHFVAETRHSLRLLSLSRMRGRVVCLRVGGSPRLTFGGIVNIRSSPRIISTVPFARLNVRYSIPWSAARNTEVVSVEISSRGRLEPRANEVVSVYLQSSVLIRLPLKIKRLPARFQIRFWRTAGRHGGACISPTPDSLAIARQECRCSRSAVICTRSTPTLFLPSAAHRLPLLEVNQPRFCNSSLRRSRPACTALIVLESCISARFCTRGPQACRKHTKLWGASWH
jgi:hypothetical protein